MPGRTRAAEVAIGELLDSGKEEEKDTFLI